MNSRATQAECLERRISANRDAQAVNLENWIFERIAVREGDRVLELCCGMGGQTLGLLRAVGDTGSVTGVDISRDALRSLSDRAAGKQHQLNLIEANLDEFSEALRERDVDTGFDLIFCAYGLYYAKDSLGVLQQGLSWLQPSGKIVVIGPFGPNNKQLFDLVRASGASIAEPVVFSSEQFMWQTVLPWATQKFESVKVSTIVNPVRWTSKERVLSYWTNTTFFEAAHQAEFEARLDSHFAEHADFLNEKWIMMIEMSNVRA